MNPMTFAPIALAMAATLTLAAAMPAPAQVCTPSYDCGDINADDDVTVADALGVLRRSIGLSVNLTCLCDGGGECPLGGVTETGQTECWDDLDLTLPITSIDCPGSGQDGDLQKGLPPDFVDNLDGTITDNRTKLTWEKLSNDTTIHDYNDKSFLWAGAFQKIDELNAIAFAGFNDWRLPQVRELQSLVDFSAFDPAVPDLFDKSCAPGCTILTCSCTNSNDYWSSTTYGQAPQNAWIVDGRDGSSTPLGPKTLYKFVRAVRGGY
jgi:hypothetical protein